MNREEIFYLLPYVLSLLLSLGIVIYTWRHRSVEGARVYSWFVGGQTITIAGFIFELISPNLQTKLMWDKFQWLTDSFLVFIPFLIFSVQFSGHKLRRPRLTWGYWIGMPVLFALLLLTDSLHHLIYPNPHLTTDYPFPDMKYDFTPVVLIYTFLFIYGANLYGIGLLIKRALQSNALYRVQYWIIAVGFLIPLILGFFILADIRITPQRDITPFTFALGNLVVAWGLFRFRLFDIVPIAREQIVENVIDPMVVLDINNRVVDINPAALASLEKQDANVIGRPSKEVFANWPIIVSELESLDVQRREIAIKGNDDTYFYDLNISPIKDKNGRLIGRIIVARDITRYKTLETGYRILSEELEQRVAQRTEELRQVAELYRAVVENQQEFIVRWKPDGTRTFVNEAYCRYFGLTYNQALSSDFMPLIVDEDRSAVEEKILRLKLGETNSETETHRVIKRDGSIGWQEWTDQAIRDESGNVIEFQSVGRDITEQKLAERTILKQVSFDILMTRLLTDFATSSYEQVDASIENALKEIAEFFGSEYADILIVSNDKRSWNSTHHWIAPQLKQIIHPVTTIPAGTLKWSEGKLIKGESIRINSLNDFPPEAVRDRQFSEEEGTKSMLSVPIQGKENSVFGVIDVVSYNRQITWSDSDVTHLRIIGDAIANTLERKRAEEALRDSEAIYRKAIEVAGAVPYHQTYPKGGFHLRYEFIGEGIREITGYGPEEFTEELWDSLVQERNLLGELAQYSWSEAAHRVRSGAYPIWQSEYRIQTRNGEVRWVYEAAVELRDKDGISHGSIGMFQDITERKQAEVALRNSEERFSKAFQASPIIITITQLETGIILDVNEGFEKVFGVSRIQATGKSTLSLGLWAVPDDREQLRRALAKDGSVRNKEFLFRKINGEVFTGLYSAELIELGGEQCLISAVEDITERKKAEERILRLNRLYVTISEINQTIIRARDKASLFSEICRVTTEHGQFRMAWIGLIDESGDYIKPAVFAGEELGYLENIKIDFRSRELGSGPTGTAIRESRCIICQDISTDPRMLPWREQALKRGYRSSAAVPLREYGRIIGALTVYASETNGFDSDDEGLLEQIGQDVSFAIDSIHHETERLRAEANLEDAYDTTLEGWAKALELRDKETEGHSRRVTETTLSVARAMGFTEEELIHIRRGSILHDIGKMGIPDDILRKNGPLTDEERVIVSKHPTTAYELLKPIAYLEKALEIPYCHHEKWDGSGYPRKLKAEEIPLPARIFAVVDVWDALSSDRPYRKAWTKEQVVQYMIADSGKHFDPRVVDVFLSMVEKGEI